MPKGDPAGYLPRVKQARKHGKKAGSSQVNVHDALDAGPEAFLKSAQRNLRGGMASGKVRPKGRRKVRTLPAGRAARGKADF